MPNLNYIAAQFGQELGYKADKETKSAIDAAIDVLHRNGIYALFLWLHDDNKGRKKIGVKLNKILLDSNIKGLAGSPGPNETFYGGAAEAALKLVHEKLTSDLSRMLALKNLMSLMLTYARHAAKIATPAPAEVTDQGGGNGP
jgi:hypothetical protein